MYLSSAGTDLQDLGFQTLLPTRRTLMCTRCDEHCSTAARRVHRAVRPVGMCHSMLLEWTQDHESELDVITVQAGLLRRRESGAAVLRRQLSRER